MTKSDRLDELLAMQKLRERRSEHKVGKARRATADKAKKAKSLAAKRDAAAAHLDEVMGSDILCPDKMTMAAGFLSLADDEHAAGQSDLANARRHEGEAQEEWHETRFRREDIARQAKKAARRENRKREDAKFAEAQSLREALKEQSAS